MILYSARYVGRTLRQGSCPRFVLILSALLNYLIARLVVNSPPGSIAFNEELGVMTIVSAIVIGFVSLAVIIVGEIYFLRSVSRLTGIPITRLLRHKQ